MANKMLIDATHPEETRVVVCKGKRVEEFDLESQERRQLRGNIYLAKVTRVEPSLQAAFVDYGGNRHGFLAFSEIHPDYYQIPHSDRQALLEETAAAEAAAGEIERAETPPPEAAGDTAAEDAPPQAEADADAEPEAQVATEDADTEASADGQESGQAADDGGSGGRRPRRRRRRPAAAAEAAEGPAVREDADDNGGQARADDIELVGAEDALEEVPRRLESRRRPYKIQEVIRRRQILLVQVVKEERGTKGAALTTYLSLAGRYCVLMPNTARGGGISRKITNPTDRRRLKSIAGDLEVPKGTGVIVRTAGAHRTKAEIKRDFEYLLRLWETIREMTLKSTAPSLIYEEGSLIKRSIRDLYNKDIDEVQVEGEEGYREAKAFMRMLMPSHARHVKLYKEDQPLFIRFRVESQLDQMFQPTVTLSSGGYLVINQTEALVAIDVNSGKATREHNIEDTALQTNLEAAAEVARQLRLRDLAGLIVIDFIDMEEKRNNRSVERKLKECLKTDRARIQVGRISPFGLLEMSRQRIRASVIEGTMETCAHCHGSGRVRSVSSTALQIVRALEEQAIADGRRDLTIRTNTDIALYMLNQKRAHINDIESRYGIRIGVAIDESMPGANYVLERGEAGAAPVTRAPETAVQIDTVFDETDALAGDEDAERSAEAEDGASGRRRRRRRGRRRPDEAAASETEAGPAEDGGDEAEPVEAAGDGDDEAGETQARPKRRRGRRGGRRQRRDGEPATAEATAEGREAEPEIESGAESEAVVEAAAEQASAATQAEPADTEPTAMAEAADEAAPAQAQRRGVPWPWRRASATLAAAPVDAAQAAGVTVAEAEEPRPEATGNGAAPRGPDEDEAGAEAAEAPLAADAHVAGDGEESEQASENDGTHMSVTAARSDEAGRPARRGWWQRRLPAESQG